MVVVSDTEQKRESSSVWYFVGATFLFTAAVFVMTMTDGLMIVAGVILALGAVGAIAGAVALRRELQNKQH
ncbi:hypothetical protein ASE14_07860 [Agromyces sp. Root81]|nr:hypothetical protein ASE14_07860 [Agromyces sp. Root81]